jgi:hypothetical protein
MAKDEKPQDYKGVRTPIQLENPCGFCNASDHHMCPHELPYYEKLWICPCDCNKGWIPQDLGSATKIKKRRVQDEVRDMQLPGDTGQSGEASNPSGDLREPDVQDGEDSLEGRPDDFDYVTYE